MRRVEFFFDCSSPWTYLAFHRIEEVAEGTQLDWRPFLVGGVFNSVNPTVYAQRANPTPSKLRYYGKDLADWARLYGLRIEMPSVFPVNSVAAMRACFVALVATAFAFMLRMMILPEWEAAFGLDETQKGTILGAGLWPFGVSIVLFSLIIDRIGYGKAMIFAFICHVAFALLCFIFVF